MLFAGGRGGGNQPAAVRRKRHGIDHGLGGDLAAAASIDFHAIEKVGAALDGAKNKITIGQEKWRIFDCRGRNAHRGGATIGWRDPQAGAAALVIHGEGHLLSVPGNRVAGHGITGQEFVRFSGEEILNPQFVTRCRPTGHQKIERVPIRRKRRRSGIPFRRNLMVAILVVQPHRGVLRADGGDERFSVRGHRNALLGGRAECHLLR